MLGLLWTVKHKPECNDLPYVRDFSEQSEEMNIPCTREIPKQNEWINKPNEETVLLYKSME